MLETLTVSPHVVATVVARLLATRVPPTVQAAERYVPKVRRLLLDAVLEAKDVVPMGELERVLSLGHPGTGAPLFVLEEVIQQIEATLLGLAPALRAAEDDSTAGPYEGNRAPLPSLMTKVMAASAEANTLCVPSPNFVTSKVPTTFEGRMGEVAQMREVLERANVRVKGVPAMNAGTKVGQANINATHTALKSIFSSREKMVKAGLSEKVILKIRFKGDALSKAMASASPRTKVIEFNLKHPAWQSLEKLAATHQNSFEVLWSSVSAVDRVLTHEVGHVLHFKSPAWSMVRMQLQVEDRIARRVSRYAATNANEFVAETFAALVEGKRFDSEVMALYKSLGGPILKGMGL